MDFLINGFPSNDSHTKKSSNNNNNLPPDIANFLGSFGLDPSDMSSIMGMNPLDDINGLLSMLGPLGIQLQNLTQNVTSSMNSSTPATMIQEYNNGKFSAFTNDGKFFKSIGVVEDYDLKDNFASKIGVYTEADIPISLLSNFEFISSDIDKSWFLNSNNVFAINAHCEKYIICSTEANDDNAIGIFFAIVKTDDNEFKVFIPKYGNTYKDVNTFYNRTEDPDMFENGIFKHVNMSMLRLGIEWSIFTKSKKAYLSPNDFGTFRGLPGAYEEDNNDGIYIKIGYIISNDSDKSTEFKRDIDSDKKTYDFYLHLDKRECMPSLLAEVLNNVDISTNEYMSQCELKYRNGYVYVDVDLGNVPNFLYKMRLGNVGTDDFLY